MEDTQKVRIDLEISVRVRDGLQKDADKNKRALRRQVEWILERYVVAQEDDAA